MYQILRYFETIEDYQAWEQYEKYYWFDPMIIPSEYDPNHDNKY